MKLAAEFVAHHLHEKGLNVLIYLDDLIGYAHDKKVAWIPYRFVVDVMRGLGLPLAEKKMTPPTHAIVWLRILVDADNHTLSIPPSKLLEIMTVICTAYTKKRITRREVQSLAGKINHLVTACRPASLFMARILAYLRGHPPGPLPVPTSVHADLKWFSDFLIDNPARPYIPHRSRQLSKRRRHTGGWCVLYA